MAYLSNILVDYGASAWCDGMSVITMATDLPHEIEAKRCQQVHPNSRNQLTSKTMLVEKSTRETSKTTNMERVLLFRRQLQYYSMSYCFVQR